MVHKFGLSVAVFGHGWTSETADGWLQFIDNECRSVGSFCLLQRYIHHVLIITGPVYFSITLSNIEQY